MQLIFNVDPYATNDEINQAINERIEMSSAIATLVAVSIDEGNFTKVDKALTNAIWAVEHFIAEVRLLLVKLV